MTGLGDILESYEAKSRAPKKFRDQVDYTKYYDEMEFKQRFRISKHTFQFVLKKFQSVLQSTSPRFVPILRQGIGVLIFFLTKRTKITMYNKNKLNSQHTNFVHQITIINNK